jgi:predicted PhzF superfamily epimerase YddE/YHI9
MTASAGRKMIERVSARVFCHGPGGGNPVTVFSSTERISRPTQVKLAQSEEWESVVVHRPRDANGSTSSSLPEVSFFMPTGEQVNFCAHAAMGAVFEISRHKKEDKHSIVFTVADVDGTNNANDTSTKPKKYAASVDDSDTVALQMETFYRQADVSQPSLLLQMLDEHCGVNETHILKPDTDEKLMTCHGSIARPKTLVPLRSTELLNATAKAPTLADKFQQDCLSLDDTTGLYLYAKSEQDAWECRQFPRASYPEDPATGIAAAALACHLKHQMKVDVLTYKIYQGTAMGRPSLIIVDQLNVKNPLSSADDDSVNKQDTAHMEASFRLLGRVEIDDHDTVEIE